MRDAISNRVIRGNYQCRGPNTWAAAREMYLAGACARAVSERFALGISNIRRRAAKEGWRRCDLPDLPDTAADSDAPVGNADGQKGSIDVGEAARAAIGHAIKLIRLGHFSRAAEAAKAAELIGRLVDRMPDAATAQDADDGVADDQAVLEDLRRKIVALRTVEG